MTTSSYVERRRNELRELLGGLPEIVSPAAPLADRERQHLFEEARDLYVNEVEWERLTDEEALDDGPLAELAFPGLLAFVRGLVLQETMPDSLAPADPRPDVVEDVLSFLGHRVEELSGAQDEEAPEWELLMAKRLVDLVLYQLYGLGPEAIARVEAGADG